MIVLDTNRFFKNLVYPDTSWRPDETRMELVRGFGRESASYFG
jgi:hypothetical protein